MAIEHADGSLQGTMLVVIAGMLSAEFLQNWFGVILTILSCIYISIKIIKEIKNFKNKQRR